MTKYDPSYNRDYNYPSIPSVAGSAQKNTQPIIDALRPYIQKSFNLSQSDGLPNLNADLVNKDEGTTEKPNTSTSTSTNPRTRRESKSRPKILELASGTGEHLAAYAAEWSRVDWVGSERSPSTSTSISPTSTPTSSASPSLVDLCKTLPGNVLPPFKLDVLNEADWEAVRRRYHRGGCDHGPAGGALGVEDEHGSEETDEEKEEEDGGFDGMIINNLLHCAPFPQTPSTIFRQATTLLKPGAWISIYGAFKTDDGEFASEGDRKFHERFTSLDPAFGLRTIPAIQRLAEENGWRLVERKGMMSGNWMVFFERPI